MIENPNCPCKKSSCIRHGNCTECRKHHAESKRQRPVKCQRHISIRLFKDSDAKAVSEVICHTLEVSNNKDYSAEFIEENVKRHSPEIVAERAKDAADYIKFALESDPNDTFADAIDVDGKAVGSIGVFR